MRVFGGDRTGPNSVDLRKSGTKLTQMGAPSGVPLAIYTAGANASDRRLLILLLLKFPEVDGKPGHPKDLPDDLYADSGYECEETRELL